MEEDRQPTWEVPAPRLDAAMGLVFLASRVGEAGEDVSAALRKLVGDPSHALRFNLAYYLSELHDCAPELMWELIDRFVAGEPM